ncbi:hypothetical protein SEA_ACFISHHOOK_42 [Mycobacterium phage ACFishhook]|nr:hypothetical protein SEA_ACFISHHOOK_42 [Mycobacterium phage ACFishhook]QFP95281.1 hypothetical protein SEA_JEPPNRM_44 [Mycobacterium phage JeppNRM]
MSEQRDLLRVYEEDGQRFVELHRGDATAKFVLASEPQFDMSREFVGYIGPGYTRRELPLSPTYSVSFDMVEYYEPPPPQPKPKRTWSRAMGLRKPTRKEHP